MVLLFQPSIIPNRANTWPSSNCSDDWIWSGEPEEQWEQCPIDILERVGAEMSSSQGYTFTSDSGCEDENESHPSPWCISVTRSNLTRKRALSIDTYQYTTVGTQTTSRNSAAGHDHRDQMTQWSTPDSYQQRATEDNKKENTGGTSTMTLLLCNSCWCHWCQRPSEHCGPFSCTSPYIWYLGISHEELDAKELPEYITKILVAMGALDPPDIWPKANVLRHQYSQRQRGTKAILDPGADATCYPNYIIERLDHLASNHRPVESQIQIIYGNGESVPIDRMVNHGLFDMLITLIIAENV